ncbi:13711_t:CDS:2 [Funneliformis geosporum]|uniref:5435_t:CDS:1 n=1 Tax=Funneliformis geosporum TaxID=1117311 RepID=A0A9W4SEZ3_9GLOM|nr:5435_t:CDS:2 [Funneliformis geosporum]CAI2166774.1 13711_t:CDS:2 [Funneliformis geosporum]
MACFLTKLRRPSSGLRNNDCGTSSSCCSTSELTASDQCLGAEDHTSDDIVSDHPDSPTTPTTPFGIHVNSSFGEPHISSYSPWLTATMPTIYENSFPQKIYTFTSHNKQKLPSSYNNNLNVQKIDSQKQSSPFLIQSSPFLIQSSPPLKSSPSILQSSHSFSVSSRSDDLEETSDNLIKDEAKFSNDDHDDDTCEDNKGNNQRKTKEDIILKLKLPVNGIATRTRSKKTIPSQDPPSKKKHQKHQKLHQKLHQRHQRHQKLPRHPLTEEEKVLLKYSNKVAEIPSFSRKVTLPSENIPEETFLPKSNNPNYPIPKSKGQVLSGWTYQEQKNFLALYLSEGKNFGLIARLLKKPIKQVVEFYYYFKMSTRFRFAKSLKKELISYSSKLDQIDNTITKLKQLPSG